MQTDNHTQLKKNLSDRYSYDIAGDSGITEGEMVKARLNRDAVLLNIDNIKEFITSLEKLGEVKTITRNKYAISILTGVYKNQYLYGYKSMDVSAQAGLILNPRELDLRIFFRHWVYVFYIQDAERGDSVQIFDKDGQAVHKIYPTPHTHLACFKEIKEKYPHSAADIVFCKPDAALPTPDESIRYHSQIDEEWRKMKDVHDFYLLMHKYKADRLTLLKSVKRDLAYQTDNEIIARSLNLTKKLLNEIVIFVANKGCVQIFTGIPDKIFYKDSWLNVFNKNFILHLKFNEIHSCWVVKKPCECGYVNSLEAYAEDGTLILQIYGQRNEGEKERDLWKDVIAQSLQQERV